MLDYDSIKGRIEEVRLAFGLPDTAHKNSSLYSFTNKSKSIKEGTLRTAIRDYAAGIFAEWNNKSITYTPICYSGDTIHFKSSDDLVSFIMSGSTIGCGWQTVTDEFVSLDSDTRDDLARKFLRGHSPDWRVLKHAAVERDCYLEIVEMIKEGKNYILLKGSAGEGKTTLLRQLSLSLCKDYWKVYYCERPDIAHIVDMDGKTVSGGKIAFIVDNAQLMRSNYPIIYDILFGKRSHTLQGRIIFIIATRTNEWQNSEKLIPKDFLGIFDEVNLGSVSNREADLLCGAINHFKASERHITREDIKAAANGGYNFLLAVMMTATRGKSFTNIVRDMLYNLMNAKGSGEFYYKSAVAIAAIDYLREVLYARKENKKHDLNCLLKVLNQFIKVMGSEVTVNDVKARLQGEALLNSSEDFGIPVTYLTIRHPKIAAAMYDIAFGDDPLDLMFNEVEFLRDLVAASIRAGCVTEPPTNLGYTKIIDAIREHRPSVARGVCRATRNFNIVHFWDVWAQSEAEIENIGDAEDPSEGTARWIWRTATNNWSGTAWLWAHMAGLEIRCKNFGTPANPMPYTAKWICDHAPKQSFTAGWEQHAKNRLLLHEANLEARFYVEKVKGHKTIDEIRELFRKCLVLQSPQPNTLRIWGGFEAEIGNIGDWDSPEPDTAREKLRRAVNMSPEYGRPFATLAIVEAKAEKGILGNFVEPEQYSARWAFRRLYEIWSNGSEEIFVRKAAQQHNGDFLDYWLIAEEGRADTGEADVESLYSAKWVKRIRDSVKSQMDSSHRGIAHAENNAYDE